MAANWGVIEEWADDNTFTAYHVVPMTSPDPDGEPVMSAAHDLASTCPCHPFLSYNNHGWKLYQHHDPDHPGALPESDYHSRARASKALLQ